MKFLNDSASFLLEKLKNHVILIKNHNILPQIPKIPEKTKNSRKFLGTYVETSVETSGRVSHWAGVLTCQLGSSSVWPGSSDSSSSCLILATRPRIESAPLSNWSAFESSNSVSLALTSRIIASFSIVLVLGSLTTGEQLRVGAQSGLGPGPGWGPYGPLGFLLKMLRFGFRRLRLTK